MVSNSSSSGDELLCSKNTSSSEENHCHDKLRNGIVSVWHICRIQVLKVSTFDIKALLFLIHGNSLFVKREINLGEALGVLTERGRDEMKRRGVHPLIQINDRETGNQWSIFKSGGTKLINTRN